MEDINKSQSVHRGELNRLIIEIINEKEIVNELMRSLQRLDKLWDMRLKYEEHQNANKRSNSGPGETSKVTVNTHRLV